MFEKDKHENSQKRKHEEELSSTAKKRKVDGKTIFGIYLKIF